MKTQIELIGYKDDNLKGFSRGWGCGYVLIPLTHPIMVKQAVNDDAYFYLRVKGFDQEITYTEQEGEFLKIGFDTAHSWNNESHNKEWVSNKAQELKKLIDNYTKEDAKKEAEAYILAAVETVKEYL